MTVRTNIVSNLPASLFALVGDAAIFNVIANNIYFDDRTRYKREQVEIVLTWMGRQTVGLIPGRLIANTIDIELFIATPDLVVEKSRRVEAKIELTARAIVENYDNNEAVATGLCGSTVDYVRCSETSPIDIVGPDEDPRFKYAQHLVLEICAWES
jgi:hypothetical protein